MQTLENKNQNQNFEKIEGLIETDICPISGNLADESCPGTIKEIFIQGTEPGGKCSIHHQNQVLRPLESQSALEDFFTKNLSVTFPRDGDTFKIDPILRRSFQRLRFTASVPAGLNIKKLEWWINGKKKSEAETESSYSWKLQPGLYTITVHAKSENRVIKSSPVFFRVLE